MASVPSNGPSTSSHSASTPCPLRSCVASGATMTIAPVRSTKRGDAPARPSQRSRPCSSSCTRASRTCRIADAGRTSSPRHFGCRNHETIRSAIRSAYDQSSRLSEQLRRPLHGRADRGRFLAYGMADHIEWESVSDLTTSSTSSGVDAVADAFKEEPFDRR